MSVAYESVQNSLSLEDYDICLKHMYRIMSNKTLDEVW